mgnify:CR=1 FL=1
MNNPSGKKLEKLVFGIFDQMVEGADKYVTKQGSTWLIFTEDKRWVVEFTNDKTLWFNYNLFQNELDLIGKDCTEERDLIKNWFESRFLNKPKVWATFNHAIDSNQAVEDTIQNGVKETIDLEMDDEEVVEYFIENGVKETLNTEYMPQEMVEETIENGIKETKTPGRDGNIQSTLEWVSKNGTFSVRELIDGVIENGVKETKIGAPDNRDYFIKDTIENGVKLTNSSLQIDGSCVIEDVIKEGVKETCCHDMKLTKSVEKIIQKGIKNTYSDILPKEYDWSNQFDVQEVIDNGVKHTEYGDWEDGDERLDDIIQNGVKATLNDPHHRRREVVQTIKESIKETIGEDYHHKNRIDGVIKNGVKETLSSIYPIERVVEKVVEVGVLETKSMDEWVNTDYIVNKVMNNSIKEVQPLPAQDGNRDWGKYYYRREDITKPHTKYVDDVLEKGEKI